MPIFSDPVQFFRSFRIGRPPFQNPYPGRGKTPVPGEAGHDDIQCFVDTLFLGEEQCCTPDSEMAQYASPYSGPASQAGYNQAANSSESSASAIQSCGCGDGRKRSLISPPMSPDGIAAFQVWHGQQPTGPHYGLSREEYTALVRQKFIEFGLIDARLEAFFAWMRENRWAMHPETNCEEWRALRAAQLEELNSPT